MPFRAPPALATLVLATLALASVAACTDARADHTPRRPPAAVSPVAGAPALDSARLAAVHARAAALPKLRSLLVQWHDTLVAERYYGGATAARPANLKSASKSVISALVGLAAAEGRLPGVDTPMATLLAPADARLLDAAKRRITVEDLLTMRAGLQSTSIRNYGAWVSSRDWIRYALTRPLEAPPGHEGGPMIYSTGNTHLLAAILVRGTGEPLDRFYARTLARPLGIVPRPWPTDPRGIHFGGNDMRMTPREALRFGGLYLHGGIAPPGTPAAGQRVLPRAWIDSSWVRRTVSGFSGHAYGYGWWQRDVTGARGTYPVHFAWGYGGQFVFVVPALGLVMVATSDPDASERDRTHLDAVHGMLDEVVRAVGG